MLAKVPDSCECQTRWGVDSCSPMCRLRAAERLLAGVVGWEDQSKATRHFPHQAAECLFLLTHWDQGQGTREVQEWYGVGWLPLPPKQVATKAQTLVLKSYMASLTPSNNFIHTNVP